MGDPHGPGPNHSLLHVWLILSLYLVYPDPVKHLLRCLEPDLCGGGPVVRNARRSFLSQDVSMSDPTYSST